MGCCVDVMQADVLPELELEVGEVLAKPAVEHEDTRQAVEEQRAAALVEAVRMAMTVGVIII